MAVETVNHTPEAAKPAKPEAKAPVWLPVCSRGQELEDQRKAQPVTAESITKLEQAGVLPRCRLEGELQPVRPENALQKQMMQLYQTRMLDPNTLKTITTGPDGNPADDATVQKRMLAIKKDFDNGVWGSESQLGFRDYLNYIQNQMVPSRIRAHASMGLPMPPDVPIKMPAEQDGQTVSLEKYDAMLAQGKLFLDLGIKTDHIPTYPDDFNKIEGTRRWVGDSLRAEAKQRAAWEDQAWDKQIDDGIYPESFRFPKDLKPDDPSYAGKKEQWRDNMRNWDCLRQLVVRNLDEMQYLEEQAHKGMLQGGSEIVQKVFGSFEPMSHLTLFHDLGLPKGIKVTYDDKGHVQNIQFPKDLKPGDPRFNGWMDWVNESTAQGQNAIKEVGFVEKNSDKAIGWGDIELRSSVDKATLKSINKMAALDSNRRLVQIYDPTQVEKDPKDTQPTVLKGEDASKALTALEGDVAAGKVKEVDLEKLTDEQAIRTATAMAYVERKTARTWRST
jgi:hypothetical protein